MRNPSMTSASLSFSTPVDTDSVNLDRQRGLDRQPVRDEQRQRTKELELQNPNGIEAPFPLLEPNIDIVLSIGGDGQAGKRPAPLSPGELYLREVQSRLRYFQFLANDAIAQVDDEGFFYARGRDSNSIAILVKHLVGNMRSRFTDFLISDGEKPDRNRDDEFQRFVRDTRERLEMAFEHAWELVIDTVDEITVEMLSETVYIRNQPLSVLEAVNRQLTHYAYHVGQIVYLAKQATGDDWRTLSIPKGQSEDFNREMVGLPSEPIETRR